MNSANKNIRISLPNFVLIAGNGRNVGKTWFSCRVIKHLAASTKVSAIKVSAHFHAYNEHDVLIKSKHFVIIEEKQINKKDSSLMLQSGAEKVYFMMAAQEHLAEAFSMLLPYLPEHAIICESGGLHQVLTPGIFFFINRKDKVITKQHHLAHDPILVTNDGTKIDFDIHKISFTNKQYTLTR